MQATGEVMGEHDGAYYYTIGQRHGINLGIAGGPYYVVGKNIKKNIIYIDRQSTSVDSFVAGSLNWLEKPKFPLSSQVKIRYRNKSTSARISKNGSEGSVVIKFAKPVGSVTPGQSAVFYKGQRMLGGGIIT